MDIEPQTTIDGVAVTDLELSQLCLKVCGMEPIDPNTPVCCDWVNSLTETETYVTFNAGAYCLCVNNEDLRREIHNR